ncbi:hypothetical protein BD779DRAFT_1675419 [Infundibulicybe gibba]|nr:hypothetical protein BD779DRAFT_1675419 [Infundibulicybe gibba]
MTLTHRDAQTLGAVLDGIFYVAYVVLFVLYLVLRRRNSHRLDGPLALAQILLFCLCTVSLCLDISATYLFATQDVGATSKVGLSWLVVFITIDCLAQMILLYRCWIIWDRRWAVVAIPGSLALVALGQGFAYVGLTDPSSKSTDPRLTRTIGITGYSISLVTNALITSLIVAKILSTLRKVRPVLGSNSHRSLRIITTMLIESGLLMFAFQLALVVLLSSRPTMVSIISNPIAQIYGITPTLLNIRVMMGSAYNKTTEKTASLRFAHSRGAVTQTTGPGMSAAGVQFQGIDTESDDSSNDKRAAGGAV